MLQGWCLEGAVDWRLMGLGGRCGVGVYFWTYSVIRLGTLSGATGALWNRIRERGM